MRGRRFWFLILSLVLVLGLIIGAQPISADDGTRPEGPETEFLSADSPLTFTESITLRGGYVAAGIGMRNLGYGSISISGIPASSTVSRAYLYWTILDSTELGSFAQGNFNGNAITGTLIGSDAEPCWSAGYSWSYRANVTAFVSGNGSYTLTGFASGTTDGTDPWVGGALPISEGASLVVVYENSGSPYRTVVIYDGCESFASTTVSTTLSNFTAGSGPISASLTNIGADGQSATTEDTSFNSTTIGTDTWDGSDPQAVADYSNGNLWDTDTFDVSSYVSPGDTSAQVSNSSSGAGDCLVWVATVFAVTSPPSSVGGEVFPVNKTGILVPWLGLALILAVGGAILMRRWRRASCS